MGCPYFILFVSNISFSFLFVSFQSRVVGDCFFCLLSCCGGVFGLWFFAKHAGAAKMVAAAVSQTENHSALFYSICF